MDNWTLIGNQVDYSLSPLIHNYLIEKYQLNANYTITNSQKLELDTFAPFSCGNITIPHKLSAYQLSNRSNFKDQSVNTFKYIDGNLEFISTDQFGIIDTIEKLQLKYINTRLHVIFGDGATSKMIANCLKTYFEVPTEKIYIISRKDFNLKVAPRVVDYGFFKKKIKTNYVLYNTTPLGNGKMSNQSPFAAEEVKNALAVFDVTYNPSYNQLAKICYCNRTRYINGLNMLIVQALHSFKFWTGIDVMHEYGNVKRRVLYNSSSKLIVCAMPFAGKSTLYRRNKAKACDLDSEIESFTGLKNSQYIKQYGIEKFRIIEAKVLKTVLRNKEIKVIFLGGGTLTGDLAVEALDNQLVIYMQVNLSTLKKRFDKSRANIQSIDYLEELYFNRDHHYRNISQFQVGSRSIERMINEYMGN